jgi:hypothetical protein
VSLEPPSELAVFKRALGQQLAAARQAAEIGQQQVATRRATAAPRLPTLELAASCSPGTSGKRPTNCSRPMVHC